jgi:hypothetical protein
LRLQFAGKSRVGGCHSFRVAQLWIVRPKPHTIMKTIHQIIGTLWIALCGFFAASLSLATYHVITTTNYRVGNLAVLVLFAVLYLAGVVGSFYVFRGSQWGRILVGIIALLTVAASLLGLFAFFDSAPYSAVGVAFDVLAVVSAGILLFSRRHVSA